MASVRQSHNMLSDPHAVTNGNTHTHRNTHMRRPPVDPRPAPLETGSVRLQLNLKVKGGYENVSTVYPGDFLKIILRLFTIWPRHGDQLWAGLQPGEVSRGIVKYCHLRTCLCHELPSVRRMEMVWFFYSGSNTPIFGWTPVLFLQRLILSLLFTCEI